MPGCIARGPIDCLCTNNHDIASEEGAVLSVDPRFAVLPGVLGVGTSLSFAPADCRGRGARPGRTHIGGS